MSFPISTRLQQVPISAVRKLTPYAEAAKSQGVNVLHLNIGDPDIKTPSTLIDVLHNWNINPIRYANARGEPSLLKALASYYGTLGYPEVTAQNTLVTVGGSEAILFVLFGIAAAGDEVLVFEPYYSNYATCAAFSGVSLKAISTSAEHGFHLPDKKSIVNAITPKTKALLICTPNNPTGTIYSHEEMALLVSIAKEYNLYLISDEVYREFAYDTPHTSILSFAKELPNQIILLDSLSKRYSLCGARIGIIHTQNTELFTGIIKLAQGRLSGGLIDQIMAANLLSVPEEWMTTVREEYRKRRDLIFSELPKIPGVRLTKPEGAFYTMVTLPVENAEAFCIFLLEKFRINNETVMLAPGAGFYQSAGLGIDQVRLAYVLNEQDLNRAISIIRKGLATYHST